MFARVPFQDIGTFFAQLGVSPKRDTIRACQKKIGDLPEFARLKGSSKRAALGQAFSAAMIFKSPILLKHNIRALIRISGQNIAT